MSKLNKPQATASRSRSMATRNYADFITILARDNPLRVFIHKDKPKKLKVKKLGGRP
jgi:hypothetical protein